MMHKKVSMFIVVALFSLTLCGAIVMVSAPPVSATNSNAAVYGGSADKALSRSWETYVPADTTVTLTPVLTATASVTKVNQDEFFTISGTLKILSPVAGVSGAVIDFGKSTDNGATWVGTGRWTYTDADGYYSVSIREAKAGTYQYQAYYMGTTNLAKANARTGPVVVNAVADKPKKLMTELTINVNKTLVEQGEPFTLSGTLKAASGEGVDCVEIWIQRSTDNGATWSDASGRYGRWGSVTNNGSWNISVMEETPGTYQYRAVFNGITYLAKATSASTVPVTVTASLK